MPHQVILRQLLLRWLTCQVRLLRNVTSIFLRPAPASVLIKFRDTASSIITKTNAPLIDFSSRTNVTLVCPTTIS